MAPAQGWHAKSWSVPNFLKILKWRSGIPEPEKYATLFIRLSWNGTFYIVQKFVPMYPSYQHYANLNDLVLIRIWLSSRFSEGIMRLLIMILSIFSLWVFVLIFATVNSVVNTTTLIWFTNYNWNITQTTVFTTEPATVRIIFFKRIYLEL